MKHSLLTLFVATAVLTATAFAREAEPNAELNAKTAEAIALLKKNYPELEKRFNESAGYAVFPAVLKVAVAIGAAHDEGEVFAKGGKLIGTATTTQITLGIALGFEKYAQVIFFETKEALDRFTRGRWAADAQASGVAAAGGGIVNAKYWQCSPDQSMPKAGLMFEATLGAQKFWFAPLKNVPLY